MGSLYLVRDITKYREKEVTGDKPQEIVYELPCGSKYIGQTARSLQVRLKEHLNNIRRMNNIPVLLNT